MPSLARQLPVIGAKPGTHVEPLPGRKFVPLELEAIDAVAIAELVPAGDGTFRLVARICPQWFSCSTKNLRRLGIGISGSSMLRLIRAGFVEGRNETPQVTQFNYFSYRDHQIATNDPEFWDRTEPGQAFTNRQRYSQAIRG